MFDTEKVWLRRRRRAVFDGNHSVKLYQEFIRNNAMVAAGLLLTQAQSLLLVPLIVKTAGADIYGSFVLLNSILVLTCTLATLGVDFRCRRFLPSTNDREGRRRLFFPQANFQWVAVAICGSLLIGLWPWFGRRLLQISTPFYPGCIAAFMLAYCGYGIGQHYFRYTHRMALVSASGLAYAGFTLFAVFLMNLLGWGLSLNRLVGAQVLSCGIVAAVFGTMIYSEVGLKITFSRVADYVADIRLGFPIILANMVEIVLSSSDRFVIAAYLSPTEVGHYAPAYSLGSLILFLPKVSGVVLQPLMSRAVDAGRPEEAGYLVNHTIRAFLFLAFPFVVGSALLGVPLLTLFANKEVAVAGRYVVPCVALGTAVYGINYILSNIFFVRMKTKAIFQANTIAATANLVLNVVGLYFFRNILVSAITTLVSYLISFSFICWALADESLVKPDWSGIVKSIAASALMAAIILGVRGRLPTELAMVGSTAILVAAGLLSYGVALLLLGAISRKELLYLKEAFVR